MQISAEQLANLQRLAPEIILCATGILVMVLDPFVGPLRQRALGYLALAGAIAAFCSIRLVAMDQGLAYSGLIDADAFSVFVHTVVIGAAAIAILGSFSYLDQEGLQRGEYYALVLFATAGMGILAGANELVTAFIGLEMSSISTYILAGFRRRALASNEASLKYFLLGSFATAFFLYGIAMTYGATGTTRIDKIQAAFQATPPAGLAILGLGLMFVGLGFKVVAAPFQIYAPDVYQGSPDARDGAARIGSEGRYVRGDGADLLRGIRRVERFVVLGCLGFGSADDVHRKFRGAGADEREADAGVFVDRACGIYSGGVRGGNGPGRRCDFVLSRFVRADEDWRVPGAGASGPA